MESTCNIGLNECWGVLAEGNPRTHRVCLSPEPRQYTCKGGEFVCDYPSLLTCQMSRSVSLLFLTVSPTHTYSEGGRKAALPRV